MSSKEWHGMPIHEFVAGKMTAPPKAASFRATQGVGDGSRYAHVHFTGNYGGNACGQYQEADKYNITRDTAHQVAWSLFGLCGHKIYYYDQHGHLVMSE